MHYNDDTSQHVQNCGGQKHFNRFPQIICMSSAVVQTGLFVFGATAPQWAKASSFTRFLDHTRRRTTVGWTPLDE